MQVASFSLVSPPKLRVFPFLASCPRSVRCDLCISFIPCSVVSSIWLCEQWVMKLQGIAEINKLKVTDVLLFRERYSCVCSTMYRVLCTMYRVPLIQLLPRQCNRPSSVCPSQRAALSDTPTLVPVFQQWHLVATYRRRRETKTCARNLQLREGKAVGVRNFRKAVLFALDGSVFSFFFPPACCL